jgi:hypothetical protein
LAEEFRKLGGIFTTIGILFLIAGVLLVIGVVTVRRATTVRLIACPSQTMVCEFAEKTGFFESVVRSWSYFSYILRHRPGFFNCGADQERGQGQARLLGKPFWLLLPLDQEF